MSKRLTQEEYIKRVAEINPNIEVVGLYVKNNIKILHRCKIDGYEWHTTPSSVLQGHGCPKCGKQERYGHDGYKKRVEEVNPNIEVIGTYVNTSTPILHRCKIDGHEWMVRPNGILSGRGCPKCGGTMLKSQDEYVNEIKFKNPSIIVVGKYINHTTKIMHKCLIHNYEWMVKPASVLNGCGCPICTMEKARKRLARTHDEYIEEIAIINKNISVIGRYINSTTKITHKCLICGFEWDTLPDNILHGHGCPMCAKITSSEKRKWSHKEYVAMVEKFNPNIEVVGEYVIARTPILHRCKIDNHEWYIAPCSILSGHDCPICAGNQKYDHKEYVKKVAETNPDIEILGEYIDALTPILHKCKIDGCEWMVRPSAVLYGGGCPQCNTSKGEKTIANWLKKNNILYEFQKIFIDCKNVRPLPFDFYLPEYNMCIEFQGKQHYEPIEYFGGQKTFDNQVLRDNIKKEYCQKNNILLIEIPYYSNFDEELLRLYDLINVSEKGVVT